MASYTQASSVKAYALSGDARINGLLFADAVYRNAWATRSGGRTQISYSFIWGNGVASVFAPGYGNEPTAATTGAVPASAAADVARAFQAWADVANITFTAVAETAQGTVGDIRIGLSSRTGTDVWGYTRVTAGGADNAHGDIWINPLFARDSWAVDSYNFAALMHEIGHALGLDHPSTAKGMAAAYDQRNYTIMSYNDPPGIYAYNADTQNFDYVLRTPMVYDIAAIQAIYGANMAYHTGDNRYVYTPDDPFYATIWDAGGLDTIDLRAFDKPCWVDLHPGAYSMLGFTNVAVADNLGIAYGVTIESLFGGSGADTLVGNDALNRIFGGSGNDRIYGYAGNDRLSGGSGADIISGGDGNDMIVAGKDPGDDRYVGGPGNDLVTYAGAAAGITVDLVTGVGNAVAAGLGTDTLSGVERVTGGAFADTILGDALDNVLSGNGGDDVLDGRAGDDALRGGVGRDRMTGGSGADRFIFERLIEFGGTSAATCDLVVDFSHAEGDRIVLAPIDANALTSADDDFTFIGSAAFHSIAGELRAAIEGGQTLISGDVDGDGVADFMVVLQGAITLTRYDFYL